MKRTIILGGVAEKEQENERAIPFTVDSLGAELDTSSVALSRDEDVSVENQPEKTTLRRIASNNQHNQ